MSDFAQLSQGDGTIFLVRWRGRQEGPYPGPVIAAKLATHEIGMLHEVYYESKWITIRDYIVVREVALRAEEAARAQIAQAQGETRAREKEELRRVDSQGEERRKDELLAAELLRRAGPVPDRMSARGAARPHRGQQILALALIGLFICGPVCVAAWLMGAGDLRQMDAGRMDDAGRMSTNVGRIIGALGTGLWIVGIFAWFFLRSH